MYNVWQDTKLVQYFWKTDAFKSLENPSIQTWIQTLLSRKIPDIELQKKGIAGENWFSSRRENSRLQLRNWPQSHFQLRKQNSPLSSQSLLENLLFTKHWQYHDMWYNISLWWYHDMWHNISLREKQLYIFTASYERKSDQALICVFGVKFFRYYPKSPPWKDNLDNFLIKEGREGRW